MNSLKRNLAGQVLYFSAVDPTTGVGVAGINWSGGWHKDGAASVVAAGGFGEDEGGLYHYLPTQSETDCEGFALRCIVVGGPSHPDVFVAGTTTPAAADGSVLAAVQPHYAPLKGTEVAGLLAGCDVRDVLGNVHGSVGGSLAGSVAVVNGLADAAVDALLDHVNGIQAGTTLRQGFRQLLAALVNVQSSFAHAEHRGPTVVPIQPLYATGIREALADATEALQRLLLDPIASNDPPVVTGDLATACHQLAVALDAVRSSSL